MSEQKIRPAGCDNPRCTTGSPRKEHILNEVLALNRVSLDFVAELGAQPGSAALRLYPLLHFDTYQLCLSPLDISEVERLAERQPEVFDAWATRRRCTTI